MFWTFATGLLIQGHGSMNYQDVKAFTKNLETVEIAYGLDSLAYGICVVYATVDTAAKSQRFDINIKNAMAFLQWTQRQVPVDSPAGYGRLVFFWD